MWALSGVAFFEIESLSPKYEMSSKQKIWTMINNKKGLEALRLQVDNVEAGEHQERGRGEDGGESSSDQSKQDGSRSSSVSEQEESQIRGLRNRVELQNVLLSVREVGIRWYSSYQGKQLTKYFPSICKIASSASRLAGPLGISCTKKGARKAVGEKSRHSKARGTGEEKDSTAGNDDDAN